MDYAFFALQVVVKTYPQDPLRAKLHALISGSPAEASLAEKRAFYKNLTAVLNEALPSFDRGFWDFIRGRKAEAEFDAWCSELEGSIATERDELGEAQDEVHRLSTDKDYIVVTLAFLVEAGSRSDELLGERCDMPEAQYFSRQTFGRLIAAVPALGFANVKADAVYIIPGNDQDGLSADDLISEGYEYLKPLTA
jgi:hypothetical protein